MTFMGRNLTTMTLMNGEVIWLCFLTCKADSQYRHFIFSDTKSPTVC